MLKAIFVLALAYCVLIASLYLVQRRLLFMPNVAIPDPVDAGVPEMRVVVLTTGDGLQLRSWYRPADGNRPTIVYFQGNAGNIGARGFKARYFLDHGYGLLLVGHRGYGGNPGSPSESGFLDDGRAALAFLAATGVASNTHVLYGESLGSGVAVALAAEEPVPPAAVILEAPFDSIEALAAARYWFVPVRYLVKDRFDSMARIGGLGSPLLVLHGERDSVVPIGNARRLYEAAPEPKRWQIFTEGRHSDLYDHGAWRVIRGFLEDLALRRPDDRAFGHEALVTPPRNRGP